MTRGVLEDITQVSLFSSWMFNRECADSRVLVFIALKYDINISNVMQDTYKGIKLYV